MKAGFETLVNAGFQPELAYFECVNEMKLIVDLIYEKGLAYTREVISNTAEYGDYITQEKIITEDSKENMKKILNDIQTGEFAKNWIKENKSGNTFIKKMRKKERKLSIVKTYEKLIKKMPWINQDEDIFD
jgi:ketol-acid reductoisomerase